MKFQGVAYVRINSNQQPLSQYTDRERALWQITSRYSFEADILLTHQTPEQIVSSFEIEKLFELLPRQVETPESFCPALEDLDLVKSDLQGAYDVLNILGLACAKNLDEFQPLRNKGVRVITYKGRDKLNATHDREGAHGYAVRFRALLSYVMYRIPSEEVMRHGIRTKVSVLPELSIREFIANALIHQDFTAQGQRPVIEIFSDKVKITNPGEPLVETDRFIDSPSKSRNNNFSRLMRLAGLCEERGSGVDRALVEIEKAALPPPTFQSVSGSTVVTVFMQKRFSEMSPDDRVRACYQHACLCFEKNDPMSNGSLRKRFDLKQQQYPQVSLVIKDAMEQGLIKPLDENQGNRSARYLPYYA